MKYKSTRSNKCVNASQAILQGLSEDGGLFVPENFPKLDIPLEELAEMSYQKLAYEVLKLFLTDFSKEDLLYCIENAYDNKFDCEEIVKLRKKGNAYFLELFHGNTIAFKDMALSILPYLMTTSARINNYDKKIVILTATSGDTGKAALAGFADVKNTNIIVFYPKDGVSDIQKRQMLTQKGDNTFVVGVDGNFDDCQTEVKKIFNNSEFKKVLADNGYAFSSANSINIGRLLPQVVYYVYAYVKLISNKAVIPGDKINFVVPTGNFGNILAGFYAKKIGVPISKLICASNDNKVLFDFFTTGTYDKNRDFVLTDSPSMDILVSSNLERLLYHSCNDDFETCNLLMGQLMENGCYSVNDIMIKNMSDFIAYYADESEVHKAISSYYTATDYVIDTHTAVAAASYEKYLRDSDDKLPGVIVSTASPYKFAKAVINSIEEYDENDMLKLVNKLKTISGVKIPSAITDCLNNEIRHKSICCVSDMKKYIMKYLGIQL